MAEDKTPKLAGEWAIWVQQNGPGTVPEYLGCHDFGDMTKDDGDVTLLFCPSAERANKWDPVGSSQGEPGAATFDITTTIRKTRDILTQLNCPVPFYVLDVPSGRKDVFTNWSTQAIIPFPATRTARQWQNLAKRVPGDQGESLRVFSFSATDVLEPYRPDVGRQSIAETTSLNDIAFCNDEICADNDNVAEALCEAGIVVGDSPAGSPADAADVWHTTDEGVTWTVANPGPFGNAEDIQPVVCFPIDSTTTRYLVARGTTDGANPAEIAYRDGTTGAWTNVDVGSVVGQYALGPKSLFALDQNNIWLVTSGGYVYKSEDGGVTWTAQESGTITAGDYRAIHSSDGLTLYVGGDADVIIRSTDGGVSWTQLTATGDGGDVLTVEAISKNTAWVGTDDGQAYRTADGGTTWTERTFSGSGTGEVKAIVFANELVGFMLHNNATPVGTVLFTINGGWNWESISTPTNTGLNSLYVCDVDLAYAVGEAQGGTGVILKISA